MIKRIVLHGYLRDLVPGGVVELEAHTPREAVTLMCLHHRDAFRPNAISGRHTVQVRGYERPDDLDTVIAEEEIHLVPPFAAGKSAFVRILAGVVLIAAAFTPLGTVMIGSVELAATLIGMGASLVLGGVLGGSVGGEVGSRIGEKIDQTYLDNHQCRNCGHSFRG